MMVSPGFDAAPGTTLFLILWIRDAGMGFIVLVVDIPAGTACCPGVKDVLAAVPAENDIMGFLDASRRYALLSCRIRCPVIP